MTYLIPSGFVAETPATVLATLERLAPGTPLRHGLDRILQQGKGALIVLGTGPAVSEISSGGFRLRPTPFTSARLAELAKMDGGIIVSDDLDEIIAANVHFVPSNEIPTDETGARHRTAERIAKQTGKPVVAVSEGRRVATLFHDGEKIELAEPTTVAARVNQELQTLDRLRRRLDDAEDRLTYLEITDLATYRSVVTLVQRSELVRRVGLGIERETVTLGEDGRLAYIQLADLLRGVAHIRDITLRDYLKPRRDRVVAEAVERLEELSDPELEDPVKVGKALGFPELDDRAAPRGLRLLSQVGRLPESVREELVRRFRSFPRLLHATVTELEEVEGIGEARAAQLRHYFDRLLAAAADWAPDFD